MWGELAASPVFKEEATLHTLMKRFGWAVLEVTALSAADLVVPAMLGMSPRRQVWDHSPLKERKHR